MPFLRHKKWLWRVSPDSLLLSVLTESPFAQMAAHQWQYGVFGVSRELPEYMVGVQRTIKELFPDHAKGSSTLDHEATFVTAMELVSLDWVRSASHRRFFEQIDESAGVHHHRWADAVVRTVAVDNLLAVGSVGVMDQVDFAFPVRKAGGQATVDLTQTTGLSQISNMIQQGDSADPPTFDSRHRYHPGL